ncbi:CDP-alcohol phosphatidyltransferase family protein [Kineosporia succinea]|uniref:CDP-diacylglycerol--glycerol-3-phosphate 3-phosphatidyltransferase n=1 Tax=Kineosporia succinea TaxID=84632 RepID=A0ABT9P6F8_9ACTN|nr:CDP-alcohol phosphatidyltransferase family protein [Kineosporia succinea]MDP9828277.1 CDP-diacylglycerol--glycerol-3-phosphate 3-phosphatidyltransferase [Kineosporia succinea]
MADRFADWSALHGEAAPTGIVGLWLRFVYRLAGPLVRLRVPPNAITVLGLVVALAALWPAGAGGRWPLLAAALVGLSALLDGLDGAVAVLGQRVSRLGGRLDHVCDRLSEIAFGASLGLAGGFWVWCLAGVALALVHESARSWMRRRGTTAIGVVTVSERPTRVLVVAMFLVAVGVHPGSGWATAGGIALTVAGFVGLVQLLVVVRRSAV